MNKLHSLCTAAALATALALAGCWDDDNEEPVLAPNPPVTTEVPDSAGISTASFFAYLLSLSGSDESSQPLTLKDSFAVPPDETNTPTALP